MKQETWLRLLGELRKRLLLILLFVLSGAVFCYIFIDQIRNILLLPTFTPDIFSFFKLFIQQFPFFELPVDLEVPVNIIFLTPGEAFMANLRLALACGALLTLPLIIYQLVAIFLSIRKEPLRGTILLTVAIYLLFFLGLTFAYFVVLPFAMNFFLSFASADIGAEWSIGRYFSFVTSFLFAFGLVFQIPLVFWFLGSIGVLSATFLRQNRKFAIVIILIIAAVLTPPDVFSQIMMAIPLLILYECGILLVSFAQRQREKSAVVRDPVDG
ncbi:MAG: twin-arginine translocase subunit TatC [Dethiobacteria bacterium]|jgi:sec-independent protein translocase protein TatC|nr:twin-arginine translocase subunit TatC [Bacillota bacterium]NMD33275.1 twin-arginine translocase subunit TatC [Bacillota bacterium]HOB29502.1 twin-arginine translocase subunit TatC [Bacillota bacterium]HPZ42206.1 twin-arginine translocase subunit TatC [Bacillota bacterium]HQD53051.1 twin-arginine translocase subunit TatC [Bacillota bacterium]